MSIFDQMLSRYDIRTDDDYINARHEVMQQVTLAGLYRGEFFNKADVRPFIKNPGEMDIWSTDYFTHLADLIQFEKPGE